MAMVEFLKRQFSGVKYKLLLKKQRELKDKALPVVFCGINWDATAYGFPCSNITGMLEVSPANSLLEYLKKYAKGTTIGAIGPDNETYLKEIENSRGNCKSLQFAIMNNKTNSVFINFQSSIHGYW
jgi:hypothetical protein